MGNCLKTQLKESVNNSNLGYFGYAKINVATAGDCRISVLNGCTVKSLNGTFDAMQGSTPIASGVSEWTYNGIEPGGVHLITNQDNVTLLVGKYDIYSIADHRNNRKVFDVAADDVLFVTGSISVEMSQPLILNKLEHKDTIRMINCLVSCPEPTTIPGLREIYCDETSRLNVTNLVTPNLEMLDISGCKNITGDLKVFAEQIYNNGQGKVSGSINVNTINNKGKFADVTWNGQSLETVIGQYNGYIKFSAEGVSLSATA